MRIVFALMGSRGDVQPALPVARELRRRGHEVVSGVAPNLRPLADKLGLEPVEVGVDSGELLRSDLVRRRLRSRHPRRRLRAVQEVLTHGWDELRRGLVPIAQGADVVVTGLLGQQVGSAVAEREDCGFAALHYCPVRSNTSSGLPVGSPGAQRALWALGEGLRWSLTRRAETEQRAALGLAAPTVDLPTRLRDRGAVEVQAYDAALFPGLAEEWGPRRPLTGFLALSEEERALVGEGGVDDELDAWLAAGDPPVYVGFGSMPVADPEALLTAVEQATGDLGLRALVGMGWNDVVAGPTRDRVRVVGSVDHAAVFPRCVAVVHHGGAGTTAAGLRAARPTVVAWYSADQPHWGRLLSRAGVGTRFRAASLDRTTLREALEEVLRPDVVRRAAELSARLVSPEAAVRAAADAVEMAG
ncbi:glycosyltransferase [Nocardioides sp. KR10-350]|uniref:glycosyltransferase n=1 Tax=Nocardioides cheoyonin TaxID=3156615 RepID=UPI0032B5A5F5